MNNFALREKIDAVLAKLSKQRIVLLHGEPLNIAALDDIRKSEEILEFARQKLAYRPETEE